MQIELNRVFTFSCPAVFGTLSQERVNRLFKDGRRASGFLELQLEEWFPDITFVDGKGYDFTDTSGKKYESKTFTVRGTDYSASKYKGVGRQLDLLEHTTNASHLIYIFCDIVEFPQVRVLFIEGTTLLQKFPNNKISFKRRGELFKSINKGDRADSSASANLRYSC
jgi:hypothetical protein